MGVKLKDIIVRKKISPQDMQEKVIAVDAPNIIMGLFNFSRKNQDGSLAGLLLDSTQRPIGHLYGLLYRINFFYTKGILPIFCFDGRESNLKRVISKDQLKDFIFAEKWYKNAIQTGNDNLARQIALSKDYLWYNVIKESKEILGAMGVPYINSPSSAEAQCAHLVKQKIANYSNSQDFDSLLYRCPFIVQNLSKLLKRKVQGRWIYKRIEPVLIDLKKNLTNLRITIFHLIDIALLVGTDFFPGVSGIGAKKGLTFIRKYNSLENVIKNEKNNYDFSQLSERVIERVRSIFLFPDVHEQVSRIYWNIPDKSRIFSLLCEDHHLDSKRVKNNLNKLAASYETCRDTLTHKLKTVQLTLLDMK